MTEGTIIALAGLIAFLAVAIVLSRNTSRQKKAAIASLREEQEAIGHYDIMAMANEEIETLGLRSIEGAEGLAADVLLKSWKDAPEGVHDCDREALRYVVDADVEPARATAANVRLVCSTAADEDPPEHASPPPGE